MASTAQIHFQFKSRGLSGYNIYMEDNSNEGIHPEDGRENDAIIDQESETEVILDCIDSENTEIEESESQKRNLKERLANIHR